MSDTRTLGPITLTAGDEEFLDGYQVGLLRYRLEEGRRALTEHEVYEVLARILFDTRTTDRYRAGEVAGWFAGLYAHSMRLGCKLPTLALASAGSAPREWQ